MGTIVRFLYKLRLFFLFILLEVAAIVLTVQQSAYHQASFFNSSNAFTAGIYIRLADASYYVSLRGVNDSLAAENARLLTRIYSDTTAAPDSAVSVKDPLPFTVQSARVINNTTSFRNNYLTLNQGSLQGVKPRMAVVSALGAVGIVKDVSDNYATAISLLNKNARISAKHSKSSTTGTIIWPGGSYKHAQLIEIPIHVTVKVGDSITTSTYSNIFPENIFIGKVSKVEKRDGASTYEIKVRLGVDYKQLTFVQLINHHGQLERDSLESKLNFDE